MSDLFSIFLILVVVISVWPGLLHVIRRATVVRPHSKTFRGVRLGLVGTKRAPHPADPPVCMAKLIMLRHRMQQAGACRSQRGATMTKPNAFGHSRHRLAQPWAGQPTYKTPSSARGWSNLNR